MKRKLFSAILFGALLTASTSGLTSCKDYDDDISNLQSQIDELATKKELQAQVERLEGLIGNAQSTADIAKKTAEAAQKAAEAAATSGDVEAAKKAAIDAANDAATKAIAKLKSELEGSLASKEDLEKAEEAAKTAANKAVEDLTSSLVGDSGLTIDQVMAIVNDAVSKVYDEKKGLDALEARLAAVEIKLTPEGSEEEIDLTEIQKELDDIEDALAEILGDVSTMVTGIEVVENARVYGNLVYDAALEFNIVQEKDNVFGEGVTNGKFTFSKTNTFAGSDEVLIRVNPVNADLTNYKEHISLINSQGAELNDFVEVESVERYNGLLSTRAANDQTGLWIVKFVPKDNISVEAFENAVKTVKDGVSYTVLHAVAIKNSCDNDTINESLDAARRVVSQYVVTAGYKDVVAYNGQPKADLRLADYNDFTVNGTPIIALRNRTTAADYSWNTDKTWKPRGGTWTAPGQQAVGPATSMVKYDAATMTDDNKAKVVNSRKDGVYYDNRSTTSSVAITKPDGTIATLTRDYLVVDLNEAINIEYPADKKIKGFYVALDYANATTVSSGSTDPSELNAWNSYTYEGVAKFDKDGNLFNNTVATLFEGNKATIRVSDFNGEAMNDIIGFRVFAVNLDGTLLDPDGVAFYVSVGKKGEAITLNPGTASVSKASRYVDGTKHDGGNTTGEIALTGDEFKNMKSGGYAWACSKGADNYTPISGTDFNVWYYNSSNSSWESTPNVNDTKIKIQLKNPQAFIDDATYTFTATITGTSNSVDYTVRTVSVDVTKAMPSEVPAFRFKPGQTEQQLVLVPTGDDYTTSGAPKNGVLNLDNIFVRTDNTLLSADQNYSVKLANSAFKADGNLEDLGHTSYQFVLKPKSATVAGPTSTENEFVDGGATSHAVVGSYTWGQISRRWDNATNGYISTNFDLPIVNSYSLKYYSWSETEQAGYQSYSWKDRTNSGTADSPIWNYYDYVTIQDGAELPLTNIVASTGEKSSPIFKKNDLKAYVKDAGWLNITKVTLTTDGLNDVYFSGAYNASNASIKFTKAQTSVDNIPAHTAAMKIEMTDCFGYKSYVKLNLRFVK